MGGISSLFCGVIFCYGPVILILVGVLVATFWFLVRVGKSEEGRSLNQEQYYKQVLKDLEFIRSKSGLDKNTFNKIYEFFRGKLEKFRHKETGRAVIKKKALAPKETPIKKEIKVEAEKPRERREDVFQLIRRLFITKYSAILLLYLGSFLIISAALILIAFNWEQFSSIVRSLILPLFIVSFALFGYVFFQSKRVHSAGVTFLVISEILIPLSFVGIWRFYLQDIHILPFWGYWLIVSIPFLILSLVYNRFLSSFVTKILVVFGLNSLIISTALAWEFEVLPTVLFLSWLNLSVLILYKSIKDTFLRRATLFISQIFNLLLSIFAMLFLFDRMILRPEEVGISDTFFSRIISFAVLFTPVVYLLCSYLKSRRWVFFLALGPFSLFEILFFAFIWEVPCEYTLLTYCVFMFGFLVCEEIFKVMGRSVERISSLIWSNFLPVLIVPWAAILDITSALENFWVYIIFSMVIAYLLLRYFRNKLFIYLGIASVVAIYPIIKFLLSIESSLDYLFSVNLYFVSIIYVIISIILKRLKAKRSAFSLLPAFYLLNLVGTSGLFVQGAATGIIGFFFLSNLLIYLLVSLLLYDGRFTQICALWGIGAIALLFEKNFSDVQIAGLYVLFGSLAFIKAEFINCLKTRWEILPAREVVNWIRNLKGTNLIFSIIAFSVAIILTLLLNSASGILILTYILLLTLFLVYRFNDGRWFSIVFLLLCLWMLKCTHYFKFSRDEIVWFVVAVGSLLYVSDLIHNYVHVFSEKFRHFSRAYFLISLFYLIFGTVMAIFLNSFSGILAVTFLLIFFALQAYRFKEGGWFFGVFFLLCVWIGKCITYFEIPKEYKELFILTVGSTSYVSAFLHKSGRIILEKFGHFVNIYENIGLSLVLAVFLFALLNVFGLPSSGLFIQVSIMLIVISIIIFHGILEKNLILNIIPAYLLTFLLWRICIDYDIDNFQYYLIPLGLAFHITNLILSFTGNRLAKLNLFDVLGIVTILGVSLLQSINNGLYLLLLIIEGTIYTLLWPYFGKKSLAILSIIFVGAGVVIKVFNLILSFPQWLVLGITGLAILVVAVVFLLIRKE